MRHRKSAECKTEGIISICRKDHSENRQKRFFGGFSKSPFSKGEYPASLTRYRTAKRIPTA